MSQDQSKGLLFPFLTLLFPAIASVRTITLPDFWMHIALGQSGIPRSETLSFASEGGKFVNVYWLYDLLIAGLFNAGGAGLLILLHTLAVVAGFALLILAARKYASPLAIAFAVVISTWLMLAKLDVRPVLLAMPFMAWMILILEGRPSSVKDYVCIGVAQWFWAALHPSFLLGPILCGIYAYSNSQAEAEAEGEKYPMKQGLIVTAIAAGATLLNPYGPGLHSWAISHLPLYYQPISLTNLSTMSDALGADWYRLVLYAALAICGGGLLTYKQRLPLAVTATVVAIAVLTVLNVGRISYHLIAILGFIFLAISCQAIGSFIGSHFGETSPVPKLLGTAGLAVITIATLLSLLSGGFFQSTGSAARLGFGIAQQTVTDSAVEFIANEDFPEKLLHLPMDGGKLVRELPQRKIFTDSRMGVYPMPFLNEVSKALVRGDLEAWNQLVDQYEPDAVLINLTTRGSQSGARMILEQPGWQLAYFDGVSAILMQNKAEWSSLMSYTSSQIAGLTQLEEAKNEAIVQLTQGKLPSLPLQITGGGNLLQALNRYPQANALFEVAHAAAPGDIDLLHQLAISRFNIADYDLAQRAIDEVVREQPDNVFGYLWQARVFEAQGKDAEAAVAYSRGYDLDPELAGQVKKAWGLKSGV